MDGHQPPVVSPVTTTPRGAEPAFLPAQERVSRLRLARCENVGPVTFRQLLERFGSAVQVLEVLPDLARKGGARRALRLCSPAQAEAEIQQLEAVGAALLVYGDPAYPEALAAIADAPPTISYKGDITLLQRPAIAVVGARNASANGRRLARCLAHDLAEAGFLVVSGLARGIDAAAHEGALHCATAAVLAGGIDHIYPRQNRELQLAIAEQGLLLAELPPGREPQARHFPRRNRIISGLSLAVLVVEAAPRSGSLITARLAVEQGREVFAIPGSPLDPRARGCNDLLRKGANLAESLDDVLEVLAGPLGSLAIATPGQKEHLEEAPPNEDELQDARQIVAQLLAPTAVAVDELLRQCHLSAPVVRLVLLEMELAGTLERFPGDRVAIVADPG